MPSGKPVPDKDTPDKGKSPRPDQRQLSPAARAKRIRPFAGNSAPTTPSTDRRGAGKSSNLDRLGLMSLVSGGSRVGTGQGTRLLTQSHIKRLLATPTSAGDGDSRGEGELSVEASNPGVLKLYGESVVRGAQYKSVLASTRSTAHQLLRQALERYGLPPEVASRYVLCETVGLVTGGEARAEEGFDEDSEHHAVSQVPLEAAVSCASSSSSSSSSSESEHFSSWAMKMYVEARTAGGGGWKPVSTRVLHDADKPLELHTYWKPAAGLSRRFELRRREDVAQQAGSDDTSGLNDNARRIMKAKVSSVVVSSPSTSAAVVAPVYSVARNLSDETQVESLQTHASRSGRDSTPLSKGSQTVGDSAFSNVSQSVGDNPLTKVLWAATDSAFTMNQTDTLPCPAICPYFLTLRGFDTNRDRILYPLKAKTITVGRSRRQLDDISLMADDVQEVHCHVHLKTVPALPCPHEPAEERRYWYYLEVEVVDGAQVYLNGQHVDSPITVRPGDLLGVGQHYLFLYKDPTAGHDIPLSLPWFPAATSSSHVDGNKSSTNSWAAFETRQDQVNSVIREDLSQGQHFLDKLPSYCSADGKPVFLVYARDREKDVLECITSISGSGRSDFPLTKALLLLCCHEYVARHFPLDHQRDFFKRMLEAVRGKISAISEALSRKKYQSALFTPEEEHKSHEGDPLVELLCWLSNVSHLYNRFSSSDFLSYLADLPPDVRDSILLQVTEGLGEMINFTFQQAVYSVNKELFRPVGELVSDPADFPDDERCVLAMDRVLHVLRVTSELAKAFRLHRDVLAQLLTYLMFFVTTSVFNKLVAEGSRYLCWSVGIQLQACVCRLEGWASSMDLEDEYLNVSERLVSLVDLLATSRHTLFRMDWHSFRKQYSPLSEGQLLAVLSEYRLGDGQRPPAAWLPPPGVESSDDVSIDLMSPPAFVMPRGEQDCGASSEKLPHAFFQHLENVQRHFSPRPEANFSGPSSSRDATTTKFPAFSWPQSVPGTFFTCNPPTAVRPAGHRPSDSPPHSARKQLPTHVHGMILSSSGEQTVDLNADDDDVNTPHVHPKHPIPLPRRGLFLTADPPAQKTSARPVSESLSEDRPVDERETSVGVPSGKFLQQDVNRDSRDDSVPVQDRKLGRKSPPGELLDDASSATIETTSEDIFAQPCLTESQGQPCLTGSQGQPSDLRIFSADAFSADSALQAHTAGRPVVVQVAPDYESSRCRVARQASYPEDIYIDVGQVEASRNARHLKVLSLEDGVAPPTLWGKPFIGVHRRPEASQAAVSGYLYLDTQSKIGPDDSFRWFTGDIATYRIQ